MLRQVYIVLFLLILLSCKEDNSASLNANFSSITGTWGLKEIEKGSFGQKYWEATTAQSDRNLIFRADGVILDADSLTICCSPTSLSINGSLMEIKPNQTFKPNPLCALVNCVSCPQWEIEYKGNEIVILYCNGSREKYRRL